MAVYLLLDLPGTAMRTVEEMAASHKAIANAFKDEPMVIGYDLRNEPHLGTVAGIRYPAGQRPAILTTDFAAKHGDLVSARLCATGEQRPEWLHLAPCRAATPRTPRLPCCLGASMAESTTSNPPP